MSEAKHTPGPWDVAPLNGKYYGTKVMAGDVCICECWTHDEGPLPGEPRISIREETKLRDPMLTEEEWDEFLDEYLCDTHYEMQHDYANAHLIAAAPDLLRQAETAPEPPDNFSTLLPVQLLDWGIAYREWWNNQRRAAIAKATGKENP